MVTVLMLAAAVAASACTKATDVKEIDPSLGAHAPNALPGFEVTPAMVAEGKEAFRFDSVGSERFWSDTLQLNTVSETTVDSGTALRYLAPAAPGENFRVSPFNVARSLQRTTQQQGDPLNFLKSR